MKTILFLKFKIIFLKITLVFFLQFSKCGQNADKSIFFKIQNVANQKINNVFSTQCRFLNLKTKKLEINDNKS